jgi:hypothetical protein
VFSRVPVSVIANGNKAPDGFGNTRRIWHKISQMFAFGDQTPASAPACFGNLAEKSGVSGAFQRPIFSYVLPLKAPASSHGPPPFKTLLL